jgi:hypothetical protein
LDKKIQLAQKTTLTIFNRRAVARLLGPLGPRLGNLSSCFRDVETIYLLITPSTQM